MTPDTVTAKKALSIYGLAALALVITFLPYFWLLDAKRSIILHLLMRVPLMLLGDPHLHLDEVRFNLVTDLLAVALNPGFVSGVIVGRFCVRDWPSTFKGLIPVIAGGVAIFILYLALSIMIGGSGGDMGGLWIMAPLSTIVFWPFAWAGAIVGWKGGEHYDQRKLTR